MMAIPASAAPRFSTALDADAISRLTTEITQRTASIPSDPYLLYQEREWATEQLDRVIRASTGKSPYSKAILKFEEVKTEWEKLQPRLAALTNDSSLNEVKTEFTAFRMFIIKAFDIGFRYDFEESDQYRDIETYVLSEFPDFSGIGVRGGMMTVNEKQKKTAVTMLSASALDTQGNSLHRLLP